MLIGVYQPNSPGSYGAIDAFAAQSGVSPRIVSYYSTFTQPFAAAFASEATAKGAMVLVQWQPRGTTNAAVASGADDAYIRQFAQAVSSDSRQVIISYGQEMNGNWYNWGTTGAGNSSPADYIAAYRHVREIFQQENVHNVTWLWGPNISYTGSTPLKAVYPGDAYVDWVGLDGYFAGPADTFGSLFGPSIAELRAFTSKPLLIAESGVAGAAGASQLAGLFAGAELAGAIGLVYFDQSQSGDPQHQDWRLEGSAVNMQAFQFAVQEYADRPLILTGFPAAPTAALPVVPPAPPPVTPTLGPGEWVPARAPVPATVAAYTFADDFAAAAGTPPDPAKWIHKVGPGAQVGGNNETETYVADTANAYQDGNGHLVLAVTNGGNGVFKSARLVTKGLFSQLYGHWEASLAINNVPGCWPAFWFMGVNLDWPACGEADLFENTGQGYSNGTLWSANAATHISKNSANTVDSGFHVYRLDATASSMSLYRDNVLFNQVTSAQLNPWPFTGNPLFALLNVATGGVGTNYVNPNPASLPYCMIVDYVHAWA